MVVRKLKELIEEKGLMQRQVAASLDVDTAMISKSYLPQLSQLFSVKIETLETIWLAAKVQRIMEG